MASALKLLRGGERLQPILSKWSSTQDLEELLRTKKMVRCQGGFNLKMILLLATQRPLLVTPSPGRRRVFLDGRRRTAQPSPP